MANFVNLTKHAVRIRINDNPLAEPDATDIVVAPSGTEANVVTIRQGGHEALGVPVVKVSYEGIQGLPEPDEGVVYIVSALTAPRAAAMGRDDVVAPDTDPAGRAIRYPADHKLKGLVFAVRDLAVFEFAEVSSGEPGNNPWNPATGDFEGRYNHVRCLFHL